MIKNITFLMIGLILGTFVSTAFAKFESGTNDAKSVVGYGYSGANGHTIVAIRVDSNGIMQTN